MLNADGALRRFDASVVFEPETALVSEVLPCVQGGAFVMIGIGSYPVSLNLVIETVEDLDRWTKVIAEARRALVAASGGSSSSDGLLPSSWSRAGSRGV